MANKIAIEALAQEQFPLAKRFYKQCHYHSTIHRNDQVFVQRSDNSIIGSVRLTQDQDFLLLRSMVISPTYRGKGYGTQLLNSLVDTLNQQDCWCFPFEHLRAFYQQIGFQNCPPELAPQHIQSRFKQYQNQGRKILIMFRPKTHA